MEFCLHSSIPDPINFQFKDQACTFYPHVEREVQVVELDAFGRCQTCEQTLRHSVQIRRERAYIDKAFSEGVWRDVHIACNQIVFDDQRLTRSEVACVMERNGL